MKISAKAALLLALSAGACKGPPHKDDSTTQHSDGGPGVVLPGGGPNPNAPGNVQLTGSTCKAFPKPAVAGDGVMLTRVYAGLSPSTPLGMQQPPGDSSRWYMIEQGGKVTTFPNRDNVTEAERITALDLRSTIYSTNEAGLLSLAIDPNFSSTRSIYLSYTLPRTPGDANDTSVYSQLVRYHVASDGNSLDTPVTIFSQFMYFDFHLGGHIAFGPDDFLYYGMGFGDTANDPAKFAQNTGTWRGKMLRIDVNHDSGTTHYSIPGDNPFADGMQGLPEIWATGLRNPWRWSIDMATGDLWLGDVGQDDLEEVDLVTRGGNYGWPVYEGNAQNPCNIAADQFNPNATYLRPVVSQPHSQNICVTGGYVYRGRAIPSLVGTYLFADCLTGHVYALSKDATGSYQTRLLIDNTAGVLTFAQDHDGEIYMLGRDGKINRLDPANVAADANIPATLSATGCTGPSDITQAAAGMLPYSVRVPFWSDGADKGRYLALPAGGKLAVDANNHLTMPNGTVLVKHFAKGNKRTETRLFMRFDDGSWGGFTYAWNEAQTDATLVVQAGTLRALGTGTAWNYPSRAECNACHSAAPGYTLGWELGQINTTVTFSDGATGNQVDALVKYGLLDAPGGTLPQLPDWTDASLSAETRARTYLHVNCGACHQPGGQALGKLNFLYTAAPTALGVCNASPTYGTFGVTNPHLLTPGNAAQSLISYRMHATSSARMPAISSGVVDSAGTAVVDAWINGLSACP